MCKDPPTHPVAPWHARPPQHALKQVVNDSLAGCCGFMEHAAGRFFFMCLIGSLALSFGVWGIVGGCCAFVGAALNV
jgi:hypothetical protein